jgi:hypothetical protein
MVAIGLGTAAGIFSYAIVSCFQDPWSEVIGALLIGSVPGIVDRLPQRALIGSLACGGGWLAGSLVFGVWMDLGIGAWLLAGAAFGAVAGVLGGSAMRVVAGALLGLLGGAISESARYVTVLAQSLRAVDMQLILLLCAGVFLGTTAALVAWPAKRRSA